MSALNTNKKGFTTIELILAAGWASIIIFAAYSGVYAVLGQNRTAKLIVNDNEFVSSISQEISLPSKCTSNTKGVVIPPVGTKVPLPLVNYTGYGNSTGVAINTSVAPYLIPGTAGQHRLVELSIERKSPTTITTEVVGGVPLERHFLLAHIVTELHDVTSNSWRTRPERTIEVPILVDPTTNQISSCYGGVTADAPLVNCGTLGGTLASNNICKLNSNDFRGYYVERIPVGSTTPGCYIPNPQGDPSINGGCSCPPSNVNPQFDTFPYQSGAGEYNYTYYIAVGCGKKGTCMIPITNYYIDTYYVCVDNLKNY